MPSRRHVISSRRAGFVLAAGRSFCLGQRKALPWKGSTLIESAVAAEASGGDALVPETLEGLEPVCAVYGARLLPVVESAIHSKLLKMHDFVSTIRTCNTPQYPSGGR